MSDYTASSIRVLKDQDILQFEWARVGALAAQYGKDQGWVRKGIEACQFAGVSEDYFIGRYILGDKSIPRHEGVEEAFRNQFLRRSGRNRGAQA